MCVGAKIGVGKARTLSSFADKQCTNQHIKNLEASLEIKR